MSLVNNVLRELDQRRAADAGRRLPDNVRALPAEPKRRGGLLLLGAILIVSVLGGAWVFWRQSPQPVPVVEGTAFLAPPAPKSAAAQQPATEQTVAAALPNPVTESSATPVSTAVAADPDGARAVPPAPTLASSPRPSEVIAASAPSVPQSGTPEAEGKERRGDQAKPGAAENISVAQPRARSSELNQPTRKPAEGLRLSAQLGGPTGDRQAALEDPVRSAPQSTSRAETEPGLRQTLTRNPTDAGARQALVNQLLTARRYPEVAQLLREGLQVVPAHTGWAIALARLQVDAGDLSSAQETLAAARTYGLQNPEFLAFSGTVQQRLNRHAEALADYEAALRLRSNEGRWWVGYALALEGSGRAAEAKQALQRARQTGNLSSDLQQYVDDRLR